MRNEIQLNKGGEITMKLRVEFYSKVTPCRNPAITARLLFLMKAQGKKSIAL